MSRRDFGAAVPENGFSTVAFYIRATDRSHPRADANGYVFAKLRLPTVMLRLAFNSHIGSLPPQHDKMLLTDKPLLSLPITLPLEAAMMTVVTTPRAAEFAKMLLESKAASIDAIAPGRPADKTVVAKQAELIV